MEMALLEQTALEAVEVEDFLLQAPRTEQAALA
jgi:hypothetical protein